MAAVSPHPQGLPSQANAVWLHGPVSDLLFGSGLLYLITLPLVQWWATRTGAEAWPTFVVMAIALAVSGPHYGATLLRVYEHRSDRRRYSIFTIYVTAALALLFLAGLYDAVVGSWLLTIYVTWSPWHFAGQNFGLALMTMRRRGIDIDEGLKRALYASFIFSFLLATLPLHMSGSDLVFAQGASDGHDIFRVLRLGIPSPLAQVGAVVFGLGYVTTLGIVVARLARVAPWRDLAPAALIVATQAAWFAVPAFGIASGGWGHLGLAFAAIWISGAHAIQYLWVTSYYAKQRGDAHGLPSYLGKALLVGSLLLIPQFLFAPGLLGAYATNSLGVAVLAFSVGNLHHFLLDGAIWKLRDGRVARILLDDVSDADADADTTRGYSPLRVALFALGALCLLRSPYAFWQIEIATETEGTTRERVERAADRLSFLGIERASVFANVGQYREREGDRVGAIAAYERAFELAPSDTRLALRVVQLLIEGDASDRVQALELADGVVADTEGTDPVALRALAQAARANGQSEAAARASAAAKALRDQGALPGVQGE